MLNSIAQFGVTDVSAFIPESIAAYRRPVAEAIEFFLTELSPDRVGRILDDQATLSDSAEPAARIVHLARHCPTLQKIGQVLARDRRLPADFRSRLQTLESAPVDASFTGTRGLVERELSCLTDLNVVVEDKPLAEASVAVVIPFEWRPRGQQVVRQGVFKVLKPNIIQHLEEELEILQNVGAFLNERCQEYGIPQLDYECVCREISELLRQETNLTIEQQNLFAAHEAFRDTPNVVIPELFPFCTPRVTAMQRIDGQRITETDDLSHRDRRFLAKTLARTLIADPVWSAYAATVFHADPHAGNLLRTDDNKLAILDWALVGTLTQQQQTCLAQIALNAILFDVHGVSEVIAQLNCGSSNRLAIQTVVRNALRKLRQGSWPGAHWVTELLNEAVLHANVTLDPNLLLFRKSLHTLDGVIADTCPGYSADRLLMLEFLRRFGGEWRTRVVSSPFSRNLETRISNVDLFRLALSGPRSIYRYWSQVASDVRSMVRDRVTNGSKLNAVR